MARHSPLQGDRMNPRRLLVLLIAVGLLGGSAGVRAQGPQRRIAVFTISPPTSSAAKQATASIPIVFTVVVGQPEDCQGLGHHDPAIHHAAGGQGDRMIAPPANCLRAEEVIE